MPHLWCILVPFGAYFTVLGSPCFQCSKTKSRLHTKISTVVSSEAVCVNVFIVKNHFQPSARGFLTTKHSPRFANDVALALRKKIAAQTASELTTVEILVCSLDFVLEH